MVITSAQHRREDSGHKLAANSTEMVTLQASGGLRQCLHLRVTDLEGESWGGKLGAHDEFKNYSFQAAFLTVIKRFYGNLVPLIPRLTTQQVFTLSVNAWRNVEELRITAPGRGLCSGSGIAGTPEHKGCS